MTAPLDVVRGEVPGTFDPQVGAIEGGKGGTPDSSARSRCHFVRTFLTDQIFLVGFRFSLLSLRFRCAVLVVDVTERDTGLFRGFEFAELKKV